MRHSACSRAEGRRISRSDHSEVSALAPLHLRPVLVPEQVEQPFREGAPLVADDLRAQHDVAERPRHARREPSRPSIGNESTSVASSIPRCSRFSARISSAPTKAMPSSPSSTPSAVEHARASSTAACLVDLHTASILDLDLDHP